MQRLTLFLVLLVLGGIHFAPAQLSGEELLDKAIQYHDPNGNWTSFSGTLFISMETPKNPVRDSEIKIDIPKEYFYLKATQAKKTTEYILEKEKCSILFNGKKVSQEEEKQNNLSCNRANLYKNYYTYLYGLPMKLKDPGTKLCPIVERKEFKGKKYLVLTVTYEQEVGKDTWYFYFDPNTYALEVYQFLKNSEPNTGEYILLSEIEIIKDIKMPKKRSWYYNKNDEYLGTDLLSTQKLTKD